MNYLLYNPTNLYVYNKDQKVEDTYMVVGTVYNM